MWSGYKEVVPHGEGLKRGCTGPGEASGESRRQLQPEKEFWKVNITKCGGSSPGVGEVPSVGQLPQPSLAPLRPQVQCRSLKPMVHTRQVKHTAKQAHNTHVWECHAFGPRMSHKEAIRQEITLDRVEVDTPGRLCSSGEEAVFWFTPSSFPLTAQHCGKFVDKSSYRSAASTSPTLDSWMRALIGKVVEIERGCTMTEMTLR